jgi:alpha-beta hydrolase superfamily lysophospholipase
VILPPAASNPAKETEMKVRVRIGVLAALAAVLVLASCATTKEAGVKWYELGMTSDEILDQVLLFYLGEAWTGMTDVNECLQTASRVNKKDADSWTREWRATAERLNAAADRLVTEGHELSAGQYYLRAASYYRAAMHRNMHPGSAEVKELTEREISCFTLSQKLLGASMEVVQVPYEGISLTGYFYTSPRSAGKPAPTLIVHQGRDAWAEDCKYYADEAVRRGYNCLLLDGPGNGQALRRHDLPFRPDWEAFITPTVDWLLTRSEVDPKGIIEMGLSMGGYLAGEAAAKEHRLRAVIVNPGVMDWGAVFMGQLAEFSPMMLRMYKSNPKSLNSLLTTAGKLSPFLMWGLTDTMWKHGATTPVGLLDDMQRYTNVSGVKDITCATLVVNAESEQYGQAKDFYDALTCPKTYMLFTEAEAAPLHVQTGSLAVASQRVFDWIDTEVGPAR